MLVSSFKSLSKKNVEQFVLGGNNYVFLQLPIGNCLSHSLDKHSCGRERNHQPIVNAKGET